MKKDRELWKTRRVPFLNRSIEKLVFIDETSTNTKMAKQTGWAPTGERLIDFVPHGHWKKQTLIAGLRSHGLVAPWVIDRAMTKEIFEIYVETQLAPELEKRDVVILDHLAAHKSEKAEQVLRDIGAWFLFLPKYSPDLNAIEMAFSKLKAHLRKAGARTFDDVWKAIGEVCHMFTPMECRNFFRAVGCEFT